MHQSIFLLLLVTKLKTIKQLATKRIKTKKYFSKYYAGRKHDKQHFKIHRVNVTNRFSRLLQDEHKVSGYEGKMGITCY